MDSDKDTKTTDVLAIDPNAPLEIEQEAQLEAEVPQEKSNERLFIIGGVVAVIIVLLTIGFFIFSLKELKEEKIVTPKAEASPKPTETSKKILDRSDWSFEVLNGSGVAV